MLKFLLIFFIVIYLFGYLGRFFLRNWLKKMSNQQNNYSQPTQKEGEVTVNINPNKHGRKNDNDGEYVEYEEIKD